MAALGRVSRPKLVAICSSAATAMVLGHLPPLFLLCSPADVFGVFRTASASLCQGSLDQGRNASKAGGATLGGAAALGLLSQACWSGPAMTAASWPAPLLYIGAATMLQGGPGPGFAFRQSAWAYLFYCCHCAVHAFCRAPAAWMNRVKVVFAFVFLAATLFHRRPALDVSLG